MASNPEAEAIADEMRQEMENIARAWLEMAEMHEGGPILRTEVARESFALGLEAGYIGTLQMLQKRGMLPGGES